MKKVNVLRFLCVFNTLLIFYLGRISDISFHDLELMVLFVVMTISLANLQLTFTMKEYYE